MALYEEPDFTSAERKALDYAAVRCPRCISSTNLCPAHRDDDLFRTNFIESFRSEIRAQLHELYSADLAADVEDVLDEARDDVDRVFYRFEDECAALPREARNLLDRIQDAVRKAI